MEYRMFLRPLLAANLAAGGLLCAQDAQLQPVTPPPQPDGFTVALGTLVPSATVNPSGWGGGVTGWSCASCAQSNPPAAKLAASKGRKNIRYSISILPYWLNAPQGRKVAAIGQRTASFNAA